jgi:cadmium resistance protein CadD (predicted permease)
MDLTSHLWTSAVVFAATDIDDLVLLTRFFRRLSACDAAPSSRASFLGSAR